VKIRGGSALLNTTLHDYRGEPQKSEESVSCNLPRIEEVVAQTMISQLEDVVSEGGRACLFNDQTLDHFSPDDHCIDIPISRIRYREERKRVLEFPHST
jgi:hypothetical protein